MPALLSGPLALCQNTPPMIPAARLVSEFRRLYPAALVWLCVALLATENLIHYPVAIMSLVGLYRGLRAPQDLRHDASARLLVAAFLCLWVPMLLALPDAVNPGHAAKTAFAYSHFLPLAYFVLSSARDPTTRRLIYLGAVTIVAFWVLDALLQYLTARDLFGYPWDGALLKGAFYPKQRLGLVLAVFAPLYVLGVYEFARRSPFAWVLLAPLLVVILLSLKRTAWIMLAVAGAGGLGILWRRGVRLQSPRTLLIGALLLGVCAATLATNPALRRTTAVTAGVFSTDFASFDRASSYRLSLWRTGWRMFTAHWVNGVGPRGYRYAYRDFAAPDDFWLARGGSGQTHPHLMALEVLAESGTLGGIGYVGLLYALLHALRKRIAFDLHAVAWLLAALVAVFPLNAHLALYGSYWSTLLWLLVPLGMAQAASRGARRA